MIIVHFLGLVPLEMLHFLEALGAFEKLPLATYLFVIPLVKVVLFQELLRLRVLFHGALRDEV